MLADCAFIDKRLPIFCDTDDTPQRTGGLRLARCCSAVYEPPDKLRDADSLATSAIGQEVDLRLGERNLEAMQGRGHQVM